MFLVFDIFFVITKCSSNRPDKDLKLWILINFIMIHDSPHCLEGENKSGVLGYPNVFSLKTLDFLRNLLKVLVNAQFRLARPAGNLMDLKPPHVEKMLSKEAQNKKSLVFHFTNMMIQD